MDSKPRATRKVEHQGKRLSYHGFPQGCRLNAVTDKSVVTLSSTGVSKIFSSKAGFVSSAKEAENGSGLIAIADNHVILLHDLKRGAKLQYKLGKTEGVIRCLTFDKTSNNLFYSSSISHTIHCYSIDNMHNQSFKLEHRSHPTLIALSSDGGSQSRPQYLLSISNEPTEVHLMNITRNFMEASLTASLSNATITAAAFHPNNPDLFLLSFADGSLSIHSVASILRRENATHDGRIKWFIKLHKLPSQASRQQRSTLDKARNGGYPLTRTKETAVVSAAFLESYPARTVSIGMDGMCRIADFDVEPRLIVSWPTYQHPSALAILQWQDVSDPPDYHAKQASDAATEASLAPNAQYWIAIGSRDGKVLIFDSIGLLHQETTMDKHGHAIKDLAWLKPKSSRSKLQFDVPRRLHATQQPTSPLRSISPRPEPDTGTQDNDARPYPPERLLDSLRAKHQRNSFSSVAKRAKLGHRRVSARLSRTILGSGIAQKQHTNQPAVKTQADVKAIHPPAMENVKIIELVEGQRQQKQAQKQPEPSSEKSKVHNDGLSRHKTTKWRVLTEPESPIDPDWPVYRLRERKHGALVPILRGGKTRQDRPLSPALLPTNVDFDTLQKELTKDLCWDCEDEPTIRVPDPGANSVEIESSPAWSDTKQPQPVRSATAQVQESTGEHQGKCLGACKDQKHSCPCSLGILGDLTELRSEVEKLRIEIANTPAGGQGWIRVGKFMLKRMDGAETGTQRKRRKQSRGGVATKSKSTSSSDTPTGIISNSARVF